MGGVLCDEALKVVSLYGEEPSAQWYYIPGGTDWELLDEIVMVAPALNLSYQQADLSDTDTLAAALYELEETAEGKTRQIVSSDPQLDGAPGSPFGYDISTVTLEFSRPLVSDFRVEVESWDQEIRYSLSRSDLDDPDCLPLAPYDARYTVYADFAGENGATLHTVFRFDAGKLRSKILLTVSRGLTGRD